MVLWVKRREGLDEMRWFMFYLPGLSSTRGSVVRAMMSMGLGVLLRKRGLCSCSKLNSISLFCADLSGPLDFGALLATDTYRYWHLIAF